MTKIRIIRVKIIKIQEAKQYQKIKKQEKPKK